MNQSMLAFPCARRDDAFPWGLDSHRGSKSDAEEPRVSRDIGGCRVAHVEVSRQGEDFHLARSMSRPANTFRLTRSARHSG